MAGICISCVVTNPIGSSFLDYAEETFVTLAPIAVWFLLVGCVITVILFALGFAKFGIIDTPDSDPFVLLWSAGKEALWIVLVTALLIGANSGAISLSGLWDSLSSLAMGIGIDMITHLNPDIEPPSIATNIMAKGVGIFEQSIYSFIFDGFAMANDADTWSIFKIGSSALRIVMGFLMAMAAMFVLLYYAYIIITQAILAGFVIGFSPFLLVCGAFKKTRTVLFSAVHVLIYAASVLAVASFVAGFIAYILKTVNEAANCIAKAPDDMLTECEKQLGNYSEILLGWGSAGGTMNDLARHWNNVEFYISTLFILAAAIMMLWSANKFVSMILKIDGGAFGGLAAFVGAATAAATGLASVLATLGPKPSGGGDDGGTGDTPSGDNDTPAPGADTPDEEGDVPSHGETRN
jgi:hypothetical protein